MALLSLSAAYHEEPIVQHHSKSSQYHSQDESGAYTYGYSDQNSEKHETKNAYGVVEGTYR